MRGRSIAAAGAALALIGLGGVAYAATTTPTATCTANPAITTGTTTQSIRVTCSWPAPKPVTSTVTSTVTVTASPSSSPTVDPTTATVTPTADPTTTTTTVPAPTTTTTDPVPVAPVTSSAFPDASTTGPTVALKAVPRSTAFGGWSTDAAGNVDITASGAIIDGYDIPGAIYNNGYNFTLSNSWVRCIGEGSWCVDMGESSSLVTDTEIGGGSTGTYRTAAIGILAGGAGTNRVVRADIHHLMHGVRLDGNITLQDSWIHDLPLGDASWDYYSKTWRTDLHSDSTMTQRGKPVVRHNTLEGGNTSAFFVQPDVGDSSAKVYDVTVDGNRFVSVARNGQMPTWGVLIESQNGRTLGPVAVTNNVFTRGNWEGGPMSIQVPATVSGNKYDDGTPIN